MSQPPLGPGDDWDPDVDEAPPPRPAQPRGGGARPTPLGMGVVGALVGALAMAVFLVVVGGNPFSDDNEVAYQEITVETVSSEGDRLCWSREPERRDAALECAILALDPRVTVPGEQDVILAGVVTLRTPGGVEVQQIVFAGPPDGEAPDTSDDPSPDEPAQEPDGEAGPDGDEDPVE